MIELRNVTVRHLHAERPSLVDFSFAAAKGSLTVMLGGSGSGKSTVCAMLMGDLRPEAGNVLVDGIDIRTLETRELPRHRQRIGLVSHTAPLLNDRTIAANLSLPLELAGLAPKRCTERLQEMLERFELVGLASAKPGALSMGERQRVAVARAVIAEPFVLLADEPAAHLDAMTAREVAKMIQREQLRGMTVLIFTSDPGFAALFPDATLVRLDKPGGQ